MKNTYPWVRWPHKINEPALRERLTRELGKWQADTSEDKQQAISEGNFDFFEGGIRNSVNLACLEWGLNGDGAAARDWLRCGADSFDAWLSMPLPGGLALGVWNWNIAVALCGGSAAVIDLLAGYPERFGDWTGGSRGDRAHEIEGLIQIALAREDNEAAVEHSREMTSRINDPSCPPVIEEMYLGFPELVTAVATGDGIAAAVEGRDQAFAPRHRYRDSARDPLGFLELRGLAILSYAVNAGLDLTSIAGKRYTYLPVELITPRAGRG